MVAAQKRAIQKERLIDSGTRKERSDGIASLSMEKIYRRIGKDKLLMAGASVSPKGVLAEGARLLTSRGVPYKRKNVG